MNEFDVDQKVADVLRRHPSTYRVFRRYGCPDMRSGLYAVTARIMSVRNAARIHRVPLNELAASLAEAAREQEQVSG